MAKMMARMRAKCEREHAEVFIHVLSQINLLNVICAE